jgi:zinc D-Ala-D-Ala carboxypeptidase
MISEHITYNEATLSPTALRLGINNKPTDQELKNMQLVAEKCFEPLRKWYGKPIKVNSFFRCKALNDAVGSKDTSYHRLGMAIDMSAGSKEENKKLHDWCAKNLKFTELINEYDFAWVHIAYNPASLTCTLKVIK